MMDTTTSAHRPATTAFLDAWIRGVQLAGINYFGGAWPDKTAPTKNDYRPDYGLIQSALGWLSTGEGAFLAAMYSFFNPSDGAKMLQQLGFGSPGELAARLDRTRLQVIADLLVTYEGW